MRHPAAGEAADVRLSNAEPALAAGWHAVAASPELGDPPVDCLLLGSRWLLERRPDGGVAARDADGRSPAGLAEHHGLVWLAPADPAADLPALPEFEAASFVTGLLTRETPVSAGVLTDNFLDVSHFSYLHPVTFGRTAPVTTAGYAVERSGWCVRLVHGTDLHEGSTGLAEPSLSESWREAVYTVVAPYATHLSMTFPVTGARSAATLVCTPHSETHTTVRVLVAWPAEDPGGLADQLALSADVLAEDLRILERMADPRLELDLRAELHTRADRASVEYRRLLGDYLAAAATGKAS